MKWRGKTTNTHVTTRKICGIDAEKDGLLPFCADDVIALQEKHKHRTGKWNTKPIYMAVVDVQQRPQLRLPRKKNHSMFGSVSIYVNCITNLKANVKQSWSGINWLWVIMLWRNALNSVQPKATHNPKKHWFFFLYDHLSRISIPRRATKSRRNTMLDARTKQQQKWWWICR